MLKSQKTKQVDANDTPVPGTGRIKTKIRLRLMIAIPVMTTLLVLGLGLAIIKLIELELLTSPIPIESTQIKAKISMVMGHATIVIVFFGVLALISGLILAITITNPIRRLAVSTAEIARGDLTRTIHLSGDGEIAMLGSAFNNMISSINRYLLQTMAGGVVTINDKGHITSMSNDAEVILGLAAREFTGKPISDMIPEAPENEQFHQAIRSTLEERCTFVGKEMYISTENRDMIPISISTSFLKDHDNTLIGLIISFEDVAHLRKVHDQMRGVDRLTTLGGLAAGIAHQVRNPLCSIKGLAQLLNENAAAEGNSRLANYSKVILSDVDRIDKVVERLLKFIQPTTTTWDFASVSQIIDDTISLAKHDIRKKEISIEVDAPRDMPDILCQEENLLQAFLNLIVNAIQAMPEKGRIKVAAKYEKDSSSKRDTGEIVLVFEDNGPGIKEEHLGRIFNPSFTTKEDGAGFGLVITRQTIEAHGGRICVESTPNERTAFTIRLPVREKTELDISENERIESA